MIGGILSAIATVPYTQKLLLHNALVVVLMQSQVVEHILHGNLQTSPQALHACLHRLESESHRSAAIGVFVCYTKLFVLFFVWYYMRYSKII